MNIEDKLKSYILTKHKSLREFVKCTDLPYSTVDGILKRGIANSSIGNVIKICKALQISADELANNRIVPVRKVGVCHTFITEIPNMVKYMRNNPQEYSDLTINGEPLTDEEWNIFLEAVDFTVEIISRKKERIK